MAHLLIWAPQSAHGNYESPVLETNLLTPSDPEQAIAGYLNQHADGNTSIHSCVFCSPRGHPTPSLYVYRQGVGQGDR